MGTLTAIADRLLARALGTTDAAAVCTVDHLYGESKCKNGVIWNRTCIVYTDCPSKCNPWKKSTAPCV